MAARLVRNRTMTLKRVIILALAAFLALHIAATDRHNQAPYVPKTATDHIPGTTVTFDMVQLPPGLVMFADASGKQRLARVNPIWIGKTEVTWDEYDVFWQRLDLPEHERRDARHARSQPSIPYENPDRYWGHDGSPAGSITIRSARQYCDWLSKKTGKKYRLPTEAEWEYACRAGGRPTKPDRAALAQVAWFLDNAGEQTHPVARKQPNAWGLYDMLGNVAEWVTTTDGTAAVAGGSFQDGDHDVHSGARERYSPRWQWRDPDMPKSSSWLSDGGHVGFRIVRED